MLNWAEIATKVEHALTLDEKSLTAFLKTIEGTQEATHVKRLLQNAKNGTQFLATSVHEYSPDDEILKAGTLVGSWEIKHHIGRGGMGDVYAACRADGLYEHTVALKVIQGLTQARADLFEFERRRLALMNHPGIARIIDGGTSEDGRPFMAMEFVNGAPIDEYIKAKNLSLKNRLTLFLSVCSAVEHAHGQLILHKDIKSQNVLVDDQGNTCLIDFGIASEVDDDSLSTSAFSLSCAAPEQLKGEAVSVQSDVFSLGVLLYEIVAQRHPKRLENGGMQISQDDLSDQDLLAIIGKCLALNPNRRYAAVGLLSDDVSAYLACEPVNARSAGWRYRASKFIRRHPLANALAAVAVISMIAGLGTSINFANQAQQEAKRANLALAESEKNLARAKYFLDRSDLFYATQAAYADTLQSMFGAEADVEKQTRVLKERWQQAFDLREEDPNNAAFLSYAIGRHFLFRNDYVTSIDILKSWIDNGYGPKDLYGYGEQLLATAYSSVGRYAEALPLFREIEKRYAASFDANSPDHISIASQIAIITKDESDIIFAESLLVKGLEVDKVDSIRMYYWNQLSKFKQMREDFDGAYNAVKEVVKIIDDKPLIEISGTDTGIINLAKFELWYRQNIPKAESLAQRVIQTVATKKGESREMGIAYLVLANVSSLKGDLDAAFKYSQTAASIIEKYSGASSKTAIEVKIQHAELLAMLKDPSAITILQDTAELVQTQKQGNAYERFKLAQIFVEFYLNGVEAANSRYQLVELNKVRVAQDIELKFALERLASLGVTIG